MRYFIEYKLLSTKEVLNVYFRKKEDFNNVLYLCFILDKTDKINILDFGLSYGWNKNDH